MKKIRLVITTCIVILLFTFLFLFNFSSDEQNITNQVIRDSTNAISNEDTSEINSAETILSSGTIEVADKIITKEEIEEEYSRIPEYAKDDIPIEQYADTLINKYLLLDEAENAGITITDEEIENQFDSIIASRGMSKEDFLSAIEEQGQTYGEFKEQYKEQTISMMLINENVDLENIEVTDEEIDLFLEGEDIVDMLDEEQQEALKVRVGQNLLNEKKAELVKDYVNSLREDADTEPMQ